MGNQGLQLIPKTLQTSGTVESLVSWFHARPLPHIWPQKWQTGIFVAELPSYFIFVMKLCFPSPDSLSEHVVWLSITNSWWHFKEERANLRHLWVGLAQTQRPSERHILPSTKSSRQWRWPWAPVRAYSFGQTFNQ